MVGLLMHSVHNRDNCETRQVSFSYLFYPNPQWIVKQVVSVLPGGPHYAVLRALFQEKFVTTIHFAALLE